MIASDITMNCFIGNWQVVDLAETLSIEEGIPGGTIINVRVERYTASEWVPEPLNPAGGYNSASQIERASHWFRPEEDVWLP